MRRFTGAAPVMNVQSHQLTHQRRSLGTEDFAEEVLDARSLAGPAGVLEAVTDFIDLSGARYGKLE